jgi:hypothetical protein
MANFDPPFASAGGVNRSPTTDEQADGFSCGPADQTLFNRLFGRVEAELKAIQDEGGIAGSETDDTTVLQAIQAMISAATGGGDTSQFVLFSQAQARLPVFPEVTTNNGVIPVFAPSTGTVRVPASATIMHRGIRPFTSVETDLATQASKNYHLRWTPTGPSSGTYVLKDLADPAYNPTVASESNAAFDSTYDDMLVARIVTNSSNVAAITNLINKDRLMAHVGVEGVMADPNTGLSRADFALPLNWARTPKTRSYSMTAVAATDGVAPDRDIVLYSSYPSQQSIDIPATRYRIAFTLLYDYTYALHAAISAGA